MLKHNQRRDTDQDGIPDIVDDDDDNDVIPDILDDDDDGDGVPDTADVDHESFERASQVNLPQDSYMPITF